MHQRRVLWTTAVVGLTVLMIGPVALILPAVAWSQSAGDMLSRMQRQREMEGREEVEPAEDSPFEAHPKNKPYTLAVKAWDAGDLDTARERFAEAVEKDPELVDAHLGVALVAFEQERFAEALDAALEALELEPGDALLLGTAFDAAEGSGDEALAATLYERLAAVPPHPLHARYFYEAGNRALGANELETASERFHQALTHDPGLTDAKEGLARALFGLEQYEEASEMASAVLEAKPNNVDMLQITFEAASESGQVEKAEEILERMAKVDGGQSTVRLLYNSGARAYNDGDLDKAQEYFERVAELDPELAATQKTLAKIYAQQEEWELAIEAAESALDYEPENRELLEICYQGYQALGDFVEARMILMEIEALQ